MLIYNHMRTLLIGIFLISLNIPSFAQDDTLEQDIKELSQSK